MNGLLFVLLFSIGMSVFVPLFMGFLKKISPDESLDTDPDVFALRPKKRSGIVLGILWNVVWGGFAYICYMASGKNKSSIPVLIVIFLCLSLVGFTLILSTIPGLYEITVSSEQITVKKFFYRAHLTFADLRSYRCFDSAAWIVYTNKRPKKLGFDSLTTNADLFLRKLQEHGIEEDYPYKNEDIDALSKKISKFNNRIFMVVIPFEIIGMIFFARMNPSVWENDKILGIVVAAYHVIWKYVFPMYALGAGAICLRGKYDGWKPKDSTDKDVNMNGQLAFMALVIGYIVFFGGIRQGDIICI